MDKKCCVCEVIKPNSEFYDNNYNKDGKSSLCKTCHLKKTKEYRDNNPDKIKATNRISYLKKKEERKTKQREWSKNNKEKIISAKKRRLQKDPLYNRKTSIRSYGITVEYFYEMYLGQYQRCWICSTAFAKESDAKIDHCHNTNVVRGLLCNKCNTAIGLVKESQKTLRLMIDYLNNNKDGWKAF